MAGAYRFACLTGIAILVVWVLELRSDNYSLRFHTGRVNVFVKNYPHFSHYVKNVVGNNIGNDRTLALETDLEKIGVREVRIEKAFVVFEFQSGAFDEFTDIVIFVPRPMGDQIRHLLSMYPRRITYHIQDLGMPGWYYWRCGL